MPLQEVIRRVRMLFRRSLVQDLDDEMRLHVELRRAQLERAGMSAADADRRARQRFGNPLRLREQGMDAWRWRRMEQLGRDVRVGARTLVRNPGFAAAAILTLALATGATTAIFSVVNGVVLRPLPFDDPDRLVKINGRTWREDRSGEPDPMGGPLPLAEFEAYRRSASLETIAGYEITTRLLQGSSGLERLTAASLDREAFPMLGVDAIQGRTFRPDDADDVAVISERLWDERFQRDRSIVGRGVVLDNRPFTIVGVMPGKFQFPYGSGSLMQGTTPESRTDVWVPMGQPRTSAGPVRRGRVQTVGRLRAGVTLDAARAELRVIAAQVEADYRSRPATANARVDVVVLPLGDVVIAPVRRALWMLFAAVGLVLAAACASVANLLLARMSVRSREVVTRAALGAGPARLARQFLAESLTLSLAGGAVGAVIAWWGTRLLMTIAAARIPRAHEVSLDWTAFAFLLAACGATAVVFGLAPALTAARMNVHDVTKEAGRSTMGRRYRTVRDALVVLEVALAFILAAGAALVFREVVRLERVDTGMTTRDVLTLHLTPRAPAADYYAIEERVRRLPGVQAAGFTQLVPLQNWGWDADFVIKGGDPERARGRAELRYVTPGYFEALEIPLIRGRLLNASDTADSAKVIVVNAALARRHFGETDPVGQEMDRGVIVGVVGSVRQVGLDRPSGPELYYPAAQNVTMATDIGMSLVVRTDGAPERHTDALRAAVRQVNPNLAIFNVKTMERVVKDALWQLNLYRWLIGLFAALAIILAVIGLYGVVSFTASARTREFAIRLALGSAQAALARLVLTRGLLLTGIGLAAGTIGTLLLGSSLRALKVTDGADAPILMATSAVVLTVALVASAIPALRACKVDPAAALRHE